MPVDDKAARKARAERLRARIDSLVSPKKAPEAIPQRNEGAPAENPREFTDREARASEKDNAPR